MTWAPYAVATATRSSIFFTGRAINGQEAVAVGLHDHAPWLVLLERVGAFALREQREAAFDHLRHFRFAGERAEELDVAHQVLVGRDGHDGERLQLARWLRLGER